MTNDQAARLLRGIYDIAMSAHPIQERDDIEPRYAMTLGGIAGMAIEGLNAVNEDRNIRRVQFEWPQTRIRES